MASVASSTTALHTRSDPTSQHRPLDVGDYESYSGSAQLFPTSVRKPGTPFIFDTRRQPAATSSPQPRPKPRPFFERWSRSRKQSDEQQMEEDQQEGGESLDGRMDESVVEERIVPNTASPPASPVHTSAAPVSPSRQPSTPLQPIPGRTDHETLDDLLKPCAAEMLLLEGHASGDWRRGASLDDWRLALLDVGKVIEAHGTDTPEVVAQLWHHVAGKLEDSPSSLQESYRSLRQRLHPATPPASPLRLSPAPGRPGSPSSPQQLRPPAPARAARVAKQTLSDIGSPHSPAASEDELDLPQVAPPAMTEDAEPVLKNWPFIGPIDPSPNPSPITRRMPGGLNAIFLLSPTGKYLSSLDPERQRSKMSKLLKLNSGTLRDFHFILPSNTLANASSVLPYTSALPCDYLSSGRTLQPIPSHLSYRIATGQVDTLPHFFYETGIYVKTQEDGEKMVQHVMEWIEKRGGAGERRLSEIWRRGVQKLAAEGGWLGVLKRILGYIGLAGGFDHIPPSGIAYIRLEDHFAGLNAAALNLSFHSLVLQSVHTAPVEVEIYCSFVTDASSLPSSFTDGDISLVEAFLALARRTDIYLGGGNLIGCGRIFIAEVIPALLNPLSPVTTLAELETSPNVPSSLYTALIRTSEPTDTVTTLISKQLEKLHGDEKRDEDEEQARAENAIDDKPKRKEKHKSLQHSQFKKGPPTQIKELWREKTEQVVEEDSDGSVDELDLEADEESSDDDSGEEAGGDATGEADDGGKDSSGTASSSSKKKVRSIRNAISQLSNAKQATIKPFIHSNFILPLLKVLSAGFSLAAPVITSQTIRSGIDITLLRQSPSHSVDDPDPSKAQLAKVYYYHYILAHGSTVYRGMSTVSMPSGVKAARLRWKHGVLTATTLSGDPVQVYSGGGEIDWCWDRAEVIKRTRKESRKKGKVRRQKLMGLILDG